MRRTNDPRQARAPRSDVASLLSALEAQDRDGWGVFVDRYASVLLQVSTLFTSTEDDAGDCFLFVCERLAANNCSRLRKFDVSGPASFTTWLRAVTRNLCIDWYRGRYGRRRPFAFLEGLPQIHRETFRLVFNDRFALDQAVLWLRQEQPGLERQHVEAAHAELSRRLTARQRRELSVRDSSRAPPAPLEDAPDLETSSPDPEELAVYRQLRERLHREVQRLRHATAWCFACVSTKSSRCEQSPSSLA